MDDVVEMMEPVLNGLKSMLASFLQRYRCGVQTGTPRWRPTANEMAPMLRDSVLQVVGHLGATSCRPRSNSALGKVRYVFIILYVFG